MKQTGRPSRVARLLLWLRPLGDRRADVEADLGELFALRSAEGGIRYARRRYLVDVLSLWRRSQRARDTVAAVRQTNPARWWSGAGADVRYALRVFRRQAGVVLTAISGLAVTIGLVTTVFSITNAFNFRPLGVARPDAVVQVHRTVGTMRTALDWTLRDYEQVRTAAQLTALEASFAAAVKFSDIPELIRSSDRVPVRYVTPTLVETFGGRATLGRVFAPADNALGALPVALVHHVFWKTVLGGDPGVVGRTLQMNGAPVVVIGVLDRAFTGPFEATMAPAILLPLSAAAVLGSADPQNGPTVSIVGSLREHATREQAEAEFTAIATALGWTRDASSPNGAAGVSVRAGGNQFTADDLLMVTIFMSIVGLVLLLAATNVASVLLASATSRQQEIAARLALGASRGRVMRQLLTESLLLGVAAGAGGLLMSAWLTPLAAKLFAIPPTIDLVIDWRVCLFTSLASAFAGIAAGLTPARVGAGGDVLSTLKRGTHQAGTGRSARLRNVFLGLQAAAAVLLLVLTMLFGRALLEASRARLGFDPDKLVTASAVASGRSRATVPSAEFWEIAFARLRAFPQIASVALVEDPPFGTSFHPVATTLDGRRYRLVRNDCSADYFETVGERLLAGRTFTQDEVRLKAPVAVISAGLARDFWPNGDALQSTLDRVDVAFKGVRIIGIVGEPAPVNSHPRYAGSAVVYRPLADIEFARAVIRIADGAEPPLQAIRDALAAVDKSRRPSLETARDGMERGLKGPRTFALVMGILGGVALTLAVIGVFGMTAFVVGQRRREISIRMALGATRRDVWRSVISQGMRPILIGLIAGAILAVAGAQVVAFALFAGVSPRDPLAFAAAMAVLLAAAGAGMWIPAQQAARLDPATVLKES